MSVYEECALKISLDPATSRDHTATTYKLLSMHARTHTLVLLLHKDPPQALDGFATLGTFHLPGAFGMTVVVQSH